MEKMKVIIRREYNPYRKEWGYLAAFPEASAYPGRILCLPFYFQNNHTAIFEAHEDVDMSYFYRKKLVHAKTDEAEECRVAISAYYNSMPGEIISLQVVEKIGRR